ncbi:hypothetical protein LWI29_010341 [Acer saccharum]|uniref:GDSL esterase/lipase n=1 Tax=Acer saccharum TaxID=4024 RepID=A0AA39RZ63_ACESA|nr:hypothetical protein LWI29_010341 [Acer saccharum]
MGYGGFSQRLICLLWICIFIGMSKTSKCSQIRPILINFGDLNSDTGGILAVTGLPIGLPLGITFLPQFVPFALDVQVRTFIRFRNRSRELFSMGESLNTSYLTPYLESLGPNFTNGANFAVSGSSTLPRYVPFTLDVQVSQFLRFRTRSPQLIQKGYKDLISEENFKNGLYIFDIGQNDLAGSFTHLSYAQVIEKIPSFIAEIKYAIWNTYQHGGKKFWVHNTGPLGCLPQKLATATKNASDFDEHGCIKSFNDAAKTFNEQLRVMCEELRSQMKDATIVYVDIFAIKYDLITNSAKYGTISLPFLLHIEFQVLD